MGVLGHRARWRRIRSRSRSPRSRSWCRWALPRPRRCAWVTPSAPGDDARARDAIRAALRLRRRLHDAHGGRVSRGARACSRAPSPTNAVVIALAAVLIPIAGVFQVFDGAQAVGAGVLRGAGDTTAPLFVMLGVVLARRRAGERVPRLSHDAARGRTLVGLRASLSPRSRCFCSLRIECRVQPRVTATSRRASVAPRIYELVWSKRGSREAQSIACRRCSRDRRVASTAHHDASARTTQ